MTLTPTETANRLGVNRKTLFNWEVKGILIPLRNGARPRYALKDIEAFEQRKSKSLADRVEVVEQEIETLKQRIEEKK